MLNFKFLNKPADQNAVLNEFDPLHQTWVVSDIKSKLEIQRQLLATREFLPTQAVLRASEFWRILLARTRPELRIVSKDLILAWISERLHTMSADRYRSPGLRAVVSEYMSQLMPLLSHPGGREIAEEYFERNLSAKARWGEWYEVALTLWDQALTEGLVDPSWVSGVLINELGYEEKWSRPLYFHLGAELNRVEADLIQMLSRRVDVHVLVPSAKWADGFSSSLGSYDLMGAERSVVEKPSSRLQIKRVLRFSTMLSEVKHATAQVRSWLESGVEASRIAVVAPDIEVYWPVLAEHFEVEGIGTQKSHVLRLHARIEIAQWLARLRLKTGGSSKDDVELDNFSLKEKSELPFDRFHYLYAQIYGPEDLQRHPPIGKKYQAVLPGNTELNVSDFLAWAVSQVPKSGWTEASFARLEKLLSKILGECPRDAVLQISNWIKYLEGLCARSEEVYQAPDFQRVHVVALSSAENLQVTHVILMGLSESALRRGPETSINWQDIALIEKEYGLQLSSSDQKRPEFEARWFIENDFKELHLTTALSDFEGSALAPAWLWLEQMRNSGLTLGDTEVLQERCRWDEIQRALAVKDQSAAETSDAHSPLQDQAQEQLRLIRTGIARDLGQESRPKLEGFTPSHLSASSLKSYLDCPFVFAAQKVFRLRESEPLDLDLEPSARGRLVHAALALLTVEPVQMNKSDSELIEVLEAARAKIQLDIAEERLWPQMRSQALSLLKRFLIFEKAWRVQFPKTKTVGRELEIKGFFAPETREWSASKKSAQSVAITGSIDRIDQDDFGNYAIIDYKASGASVSQVGSWIEKRNLQLLLYTLAVEMGLTELPPKTVVSSVYFVLSQMDRDNGFKLLDVEQALFDATDRKKNKLDQAQRQSLLDAAQALMVGCLESMRNGDFAPRPADEKNCENCDWRNLCRAPHLNR